MDGKTRVSYVARSQNTIDMAPLLEHLSIFYHVTIHVLDGDSIFQIYPTGINLKIYHPIEDMPGYMKGLEEEVASADVVIVHGLSQLGSFQGVRAALRFEKPILAIMDESQPTLYRNYHNIRAVRRDLIKNVERWLVTHSQAKSILVMEGAEEAKITTASYGVDIDRYSFSQTSRERFRKLAGLGSNEIVILFFGDLENCHRPTDLLLALKYMKKRYPEFAENVRLLFAGNGSLDRDLKMQCLEFGIGHQVAFLHSDLLTLEKDVFCASDFIVNLRNVNVNFELPTPSQILKAMACGVTPILSPGSPAAEWVAENGIILSQDTFNDLADSMFAYLQKEASIWEIKEHNAAYIRKHYSAAEIADFWRSVIEQELNRVSDMFQRGRHAWQDFGASMIQLRNEGKLDAALESIEDWLCRMIENPSKRCEILNLKGEILVEMNRLDDATDALALAIEVDSSNIRSYLTLGRISVLSHSLEEAIAFYKRALAYDPNSIEAFMGIGMVYLRGKLYDQAIAWMIESVKRDRNNQKAIVALTQACLQNPLIKQSIAAMENAMEWVGDHPTFMMALGQLYLRDGRIEEGRKLLDRALALGQGPDFLTAG